MVTVSGLCEKEQQHSFVCVESYAGLRSVGGAKSGEERPLDKHRELGPMTGLLDETQDLHRLYWGNNLAVMDAILTDFSGKMDLIYMDPPFATGSDFAVSIAVGEQDVRLVGEGFERYKVAYSDRWPEDLYWAMMRRCLEKIHALLSQTGSLFLHCDFRTDWKFRGLLEEIFGAGHVNNQIIWHYTGGGRSKNRLSRKHDVIFWAVKGRSWTFNLEDIRVPYKPTSHYAKRGIVASSGKQYLPHPRGTPVDDVWDIPIINPMSYERVDYPTQKPEALLERIIRVASRPGDWVGDFFCGSGTTLVVAQRLGRRWLGADQSHWAIHNTQKRLLTGENKTPFVLLRDMKHESNGDLGCIGDHDCIFRVICEYQVDSEKEMDMTDMTEDVCGWGGDGNAVIRIHWTGWESQGDGVVPDELARVMVDWSDLFDSWSIDVDFDGQVFRPHWCVYRTRHQRKLPLCSDWIHAVKPGVLCMKAVDVFGRSWMKVLQYPV